MSIVYNLSKVFRILEFAILCNYLIFSTGMQEGTISEGNTLAFPTAQEGNTATTKQMKGKFFAKRTAKTIKKYFFLLRN